MIQTLIGNTDTPIISIFTAPKNSSPTPTARSQELNKLSPV